MVDENERKLILGMIQSGKISADEGLGLLKALEESDQQPAQGEMEQEASTLVEAASLQSLPGASTQPEGSAAGPAGFSEAESLTPPASPAPELPPDARQWRRWWTLPLWVGVGILVLSGWLMYWAQVTYGIGFLFFCAWLPFLLGLGLIVLGWQSRSSHWMHLRVEQRPGDWPHRIAISFPLPLGLASWFLRTFRGRIPGLDDPAVDQVLVALDQHATPENPIYIDVDDDPNGDHVQIFIG
jgi:hypothetical protein